MGSPVQEMFLQTLDPDSNSRPICVPLCEFDQGVSVQRRFDVKKPMQVGGQAVIEGVMMRAPGMVATAVRRASGEIQVKNDPYVSLAEKSRLFKLPVLRGAVGLVEMLIIGIRSLNFSAEVALQDVQLSERKNGNGQDRQRAPKQKTRDAVTLGLTVAFALGIGIVLFFVVPLVVTTSWFGVEQDPIRFNLIAGGFRVVLLFLYLGVISRMQDIKRIFAYHGAEHKVVFAFERGEDLAVPAAAQQLRFHPRCGTSFLLVVMLLAIVLFSLLDALVVMGIGRITILTRLTTHLPLIPLIGGVSYEFIKFSARHSETLLGRMIVAPGLWLQRVTTKEPDEKQLEVAVTALRCALGYEEDGRGLLQRRAHEEVSVG